MKSFRVVCWTLSILAWEGSVLPSPQIERAKAPEWRAATYRGLTIGKSSRADMLRVLGKPQWSVPSADQAPPQPIVWNDYGTVSGDLSGRLAVEVDSRNNRIVSISITPNNLSKDDAIKYFGRDYLLMGYEFCKDQPHAGGLGFVYESPASRNVDSIEYRARGIAIQFDSSGIVNEIYFVAKPMGLKSEADCRKEIEKLRKKNSSAAATNLTQKQAEELVLNIPDAIASIARGGCPRASLGWVNDQQSTIFFSIHDPCDRTGAASNKIGQFTVNLENGEVWVDVDRRDDGRNIIDSPRMRELRRKFFAGK